MPRTPPDDPAEWTDDEWLEWLAEVDAEAPAEPEGPPRRRARSLSVTMLGAAMIGLQKAIYGDYESDIVMVVEADGEPPDPEPVEVHIDPDDPDASTVTVRPWLTGEQQAD